MIGLGLFFQLRDIQKTSWRKKTHLSKEVKIVLFFIFSYLFFNFFFLAENKPAAFYKLLKILEFILLGWVIVKIIKPHLKIVLAILSFSVFYSSILAFFQFIWQKSVGGIFWWLGERTFSAGTPGIALFSLNGSLFLRPYATFSHPNVFGGFLAVVLPLVLFLLLRENKSAIFSFWLFLTFVVGFLGLLLSFSRAAWLTAGFGFFLVFIFFFLKRRFLFFLRRRKDVFLLLFYLLLLLSIFVPLFLEEFIRSLQSLQERANLVKIALEIVSSHPIFGVGLNNLIIHQKFYFLKASALYIFQPVHNIYLLVLAELGFVGFGVFCFFLSFIFHRVLFCNVFTFLSLSTLLFLGFFDHYLFTLQQGLLLFTLFVSLAFLSPNRVN